MKDYLSPEKPCEAMQQTQIVTLIKAGMPVDLTLIADKREEGDSFAYYVFCKFKEKTVMMSTQYGSHKYYTNLDRAISWARKLQFRKIYCVIDCEKIDQKKFDLIS